MIDLEVEYRRDLFWLHVALVVKWALILVLAAIIVHSWF